MAHCQVDRNSKQNDWENSKYEIEPKKKHENKQEKSKTEIRNRNKTLFRLKFAGVWKPANSSCLVNNQQTRSDSNQSWF